MPLAPIPFGFGAGPSNFGPILSSAQQTQSVFQNLHHQKQRQLIIPTVNSQQTIIREATSKP